MIKSGFSYLKWTAVVAVLATTIIAGVLLVHGHANPPVNKFSVQDSTTREDNGKRVRAREGFELVKDGNSVSARRRNKPTESSADKWLCTCPSASCSTSFTDDGYGVCTRNSGDCECVFKKAPK
jgi:hypothetical protein